jgi:two-component system phosphate regulon sensor histidine kinase PhoR
MNRRIIWQLYPSFLLITLIALIAAVWYCTYSFRHFYHNQTRDELNRLAHVVAEQISLKSQTADQAQLDSLCKKLGRAGDGRTRVTIILPSGKVLGDSFEDPAIMDDHSNRPEIIDALQEGFGLSLRPSDTIGKKMMYVAIPVQQQGEIAAVVRTAITATAIDTALENIYVKILWCGVIIAVCAAGLSYFVSRRISKPIVNMKQIAQRFAQGELTLRVGIPTPLELGDLAKALNEMARQLYDRILDITEQRNELEAILSSMTEGVIAVDAQGHIVSINKAAAHLLKIEATKVQDRSVEEVIRNVDLQEFINNTLESEQPTEGDMYLPINGPPGWADFFQLHGVSLSDDQGRKSGTVIVFNDMTRIHRLENIRRDFVANVSHELKTPVTSIMGFVETLLEGAINNPEQAKRFLTIIAKHSDRLNAIIDDLLSLSSLEEESERSKISFERADLKTLLQTAIELSDTKAADKQVTIRLICEEPIEARINSALLEQALLNLIDNAIKYSEPGSKIEISAQRTDNEVIIAVRDNGCGIEQKHLPRLFERFYVVDKSRSRKLGGTGLGLAIVKHIAQVHSGTVTVESSPGIGSTFTIHLPTK